MLFSVLSIMCAGQGWGTGVREAQGRIVSSSVWTDQAGCLSAEIRPVCISLDALCAAVYICLLATKNGERTAPTTVRPLSIHQTNSMCAKKQMLSDRRLMPFISYYDKKERPCLQADSYKKFCSQPLSGPDSEFQTRTGDLPLLRESWMLCPFRQL